MGAIYKYVYCDVWKSGVTVVIGDCNTFRSWILKNYKDPCVQDLVQAVLSSCSEEEYTTKRVAARTYDSEAGVLVIHLPQFDFDCNPVAIASLSHELLHATFLTLDFLGVEYIYEGNNEAYTYLHEYLLKKFLQKKGYKECKV